MSIPKPGTQVRGSRTGAPINALLDLLGRRWALGIVWNLGGGPATFRKLQERCESISPSILNSRIKDLREAGIVERTVDGYALTPRGKVLQEALAPMGTWAATWAMEVFGYEFAPGKGTPEWEDAPED